MTSDKSPAIDWTSTKPRRRDGVEGHDLSGEIVLFDGAQHSAVSLNESASSIWELCDGTRTSLDIAAELADVLDLEAADLQPDVDSALDDLYKLKVIVVSDE